MSATKKSATPISVWSHNDAVKSDGIEGISPIPILWAVGPSWSGKSTTIAMVDPQPYGETPRTLVTDMEGSMATLRTTFAIDVIDVRAIAIEKFGQTYSGGQLFEIWWDQIRQIPDGKYTVLGIDPISDLYMGSHEWVRNHPEYFSKPDGAYRGKEGTVFAWGDVKILWKQILTGLASKFQTVVITSHVKDLYQDGIRTGKQDARGIDFTEVATVSLWLEKPDEKGNRWALVKKSRLQHAVWHDAEGNRLRRPVTADVLPKRLVPKFNGQSYPELIDLYIQAPQPSYGDLDVVEYDPSVQLMTPEEKEALRIEEERRKYDELIARRKQEIVTNAMEMLSITRAEVLRLIGSYEGPKDTLDDLFALETWLADHGG